MESTLRINELLGFLPMFRSVPKEHIRITDQYLLIEQTGDKARLIGTNGKLMVLYQCLSKGVTGTGLLPVSVIKELKRIRLKYCHDVVLRWVAEDRINVIYAGKTIEQHIEHSPDSYPKYRLVIPQSVSGVCDQYDPDLLKTAKDIFTQIIGKDSIYVYHNGGGPAIIVSTHTENILGLLMPWGVERQNLEKILGYFR